MNSIFLSFQVHCQMWFFIACFLNELPKESFLYFTTCCNKIIYLTLNKIIVWYFRAVLLLAWISLLKIIIHFWSYLFLVFLYYLQCFHFFIRCFRSLPYSLNFSFENEILLLRMIASYSKKASFINLKFMTHLQLICYFDYLQDWQK